MCTYEYRLNKTCSSGESNAETVLSPPRVIISEEKKTEVLVVVITVRN